MPLFLFVKLIHDETRVAIASQVNKFGRTKESAETKWSEYEDMRRECIEESKSFECGQCVQEDEHTFRERRLGTFGTAVSSQRG